MRYNDKKFGGIIPTRTGTPIGGAAERSMLDRIGGSEGYRKDFRTDANGNTTMLTTKNGMPQFQNLGGGEGSDESKNTAGLASGAVFTNPRGLTYYTRTTHVATYAAPGKKIELVDKIDNKLIGTQPADKSATSAHVAGDSEMIKRCPASLFTGKMRLYVQCLYGSLNPLPGDLILNNTGISMPSLIYNGVLLDTNCGVYLDQAKAKHYLISITTGFAYELVRAPGVKWLEKKLLDPTLSAKFKAKVEAYLLAQSSPANPKNMDLPPRIAGGMGYGWHFDWAGTAADCVGLESDTNPGDGMVCYKTTHWRFTFTLTNGGIKAGLAKMVEGLWRNKRHFRNICVPIWDFSGYSKTGFRFLPEFGSGPLYAFYSHETESYPGSSQLQLVTWDARVGEYVERHGIMWPEYMNAETLEVCGTDACGYETQNAHYSNNPTISVGSTGVTVKVANRGGSVVSVSKASTPEEGPLSSYGWYKSDVPNGALGRQPPYMYDDGRPSPIPGHLGPQGWYWLPLGPVRMVGSGGGTYGQVVGSTNPSDYSYGAIDNLPATWSKESYTKNTIFDGYLIGFPPYYDAEAYFVWKRQDQSDGESGSSGSCTGDGYLRLLAIGGDVGPPSGPVVGRKETYWAPLYGTPSSTTPFSREKFTYGTPEEFLICGGTPTAPASGLQAGQFLNTARDQAEVIVTAQSSTRGAIYSATFNIDKNNSPLSIAGGWAAYTGWA